jgi:hypothetical protein
MRVTSQYFGRPVSALADAGDIRLRLEHRSISAAQLGARNPSRAIANRS